MSKLLSEDQLKEKLDTLLASANYRGILKLVQDQNKAAVAEASEYQTYIYKQDHPRLEAEGKEIWGVCIAYRGQTAVGDIAGSEKQAKEKLRYWLKYLKEKNNG